MSTSYDPRFDEAEAEADRGNAWKPREAGMPNPLTIVATEWSTGQTRIGPAEWLNGVDRDGRRWSVLVGSTILKKRLLEGVVEEWDPERNAFVEIRREGRVEPGEMVSLKFLGIKEGGTYDYPNFTVVRKPALEQSGEAAPAPEASAASDSDIPF
jgi:hypothetical protein